MRVRTACHRRRLTRKPVSVNYLAPWLLTAILRRRLVASAPSRIVTVASEASRHANGVDPGRDLRHHFVHASRLFGNLWPDQADEHHVLDGVGAQACTNGRRDLCLDPGFNVTGLGRELPFAAPLERLLNSSALETLIVGRGSSVRLATDPAFAAVSGGYFSVKDAAPLVPVTPGGDIDAQQALWGTGEILQGYCLIFIHEMRKQDR